MTQAATNNAGTVRAPQRTINDRVPPHDLDAEKALLGSMMMSRDAIAEVVPIIGLGDSPWFYLPVHEKLFEVLVELYDDPAKAIDLIVVSDELRRRDLLEFIGGQDYMVHLAESFAEWANAEHYARIVRDRGMLRDLIRASGMIIDEAYAGIDEARNILDHAEQTIFEVTEKRVSGQVVEIKEAMRRLIAQLDLKEESCTGLPTGFAQLDEYTSGFQPGDLIILAGRPSMGKTALGLTMAQNAALHHRRPIAFFSMEMSADQIAQRLLCSSGHGIDSQKLRKRQLSTAEHQQAALTAGEFADAPFFVDDTPGISVMELRSKARRLKQRHDIQAVFVDYLQLMHSPRAESRQVEISTISRGLKALGRELGIPIIALAQLNRLAEGRSDKKPIMSDLRESGAIEQDADVILLIHREEYYKRDDESLKGLADLIIAKQRNGPTGDLKLAFNSRFTRFANFTAEPESYVPAGGRGGSPF